MKFLKFGGANKTCACKQCGLLYLKPLSGVDAEFPDLCPEHRKPSVELATRKRNVMAWVEYRWEQIEAQMIKERAEIDAAIRANASANMARQANTQAQAMAAAQNIYGGYNQGLQQDYSIYQNSLRGLHDPTAWDSP